MTDPNIRTLTSTIAQLQREWRFEREARKGLASLNYELSKENKKLREALEEIRDEIYGELLSRTVAKQTLEETK